LIKQCEKIFTKAVLIYLLKQYIEFARLCVYTFARTLHTNFRISALRITILPKCILMRQDLGMSSTFMWIKVMASTVY